MKTMIEDEREISGIFGPNEEWEIQAVGDCAVDKIECYTENGEMAPIVWFAIYRYGKSEPHSRVNSKYVETVVYK